MRSHALSCPRGEVHDPDHREQCIPESCNLPPSSGGGTGIKCQGKCVSPASLGNCGTCGNVCKTGEVCISDISANGGFACHQECSPGQTKCGDACSNLLSDDANCGACGHVCPLGQTCSNGGCCSPGLTSCSGVCSNLNIDDSNCGGCTTETENHACGAGQSCNSGVCQTPPPPPPCSQGICDNPDNCGPGLSPQRCSADGEWYCVPGSGTGCFVVAECGSVPGCCNCDAHCDIFCPSTGSS